MEHTTTGDRARTRLIAFVTTLLVATLGLAAPTAAQAASEFTVSGSIAFPASAPAEVRQAVSPSAPYDENRRGVQITLYPDQPGSGMSWRLGEDDRVGYDATTGAWSITGVPDGSYWLTLYVYLPNYGGAHEYREIVVNGGDLSVGAVEIREEGRLNGTFGYCWTSGDQVAHFVKNTQTGVAYPFDPAQSGWTEPRDYCENFNFGNFRMSGAPAGTYIAYSVRNGASFYYTGYQAPMSSDPASAVPFVLENWRGSRITTELPQPVAFQAGTAAITGAAQVGKTLTAVAEGWSEGAVYTYAWKRDGQVIAGANASSYALVAADLGKQITVAVTGVKTGAGSATVESAKTAKVIAAMLKSATPTISGTVAAGKTVTAKPGSWTSGTSFGYQWHVNGKAVKGATKASYKIAAADGGKKLTVAVKGSLAGHTSVTKSSAAKTVLKALSAAPAPKITGTAKVGSTLKASAGSWKPAPVKFSYQWLRNGVAIKGATKSSYKLASADAGKKVTVKVTGPKSGYLSVAKTSAAKSVAKR